MGKCTKSKICFTVLEADASRLKCHYCAYGDCLHDDKAGANMGSEIVCPKGVTKCVVTGNKWNDKFYRSCEWELKDDTMDELGDNKGWCTTTGDGTRMCACSEDNCNTGFHGKSIIMNFVKFVVNSCQFWSILVNFGQFYPSLIAKVPLSWE